MQYHRSFALLFLVALGAATLPAQAGVASLPEVRPGGAPPAAGRIDPRLRPLLAMLSEDPHLAWRLGAGLDGSLPVLIELETPADATALDALRARGAAPAEAGGRPVAWGRFVAARVGEGALDALDALPAVRRVRWSPPSLERPALDVTTAMIDLEGARGARPDLDLLTGRGVVIGSKDTAIDVFHPAFFFADGGYHDWIDVDGDGFLSPDVDAIDLDGDGAVSAGEVARLLRAEPTDSLGYVLPARLPGFDPGIDWLWLDEDGDGARGHGAAGGFDDDTPAFGEPLFVPDDFDRDGLVEVGERVARLGRSKIRKLYVNVANYFTEPFTFTEHVFVRGDDLSATALEYDGYHAVSGYSNAAHATAVSSIVAGDVPLAGRRFVGLAPDAELIVSYGGFAVEEGFLWLLGEHPDVVLYEYGGWSVPLDGSGPVETLIDASTLEEGVAHACAAGNRGGEGDHAFVSAEAGQMARLPLLFSTDGVEPLDYASFDLDIRGGGAASVRLLEPDGNVHELAGDCAYCVETLGNGGTLYVLAETSSRGTLHVSASFSMYGLDDELPTGWWTVEVEPASGDIVAVDAYLYYGWYYGIYWDSAIVSAARTTTSPAVADHCITAGAVTGHASSPDEPWFYGDEPPGTVRDYSGRGPRIDGAPKPDVVAPDNPWAAAPENVIVDLTTHTLDDGVRPHGALDVFGGTSGATPHVGGVAALLVQAGLRGVDVADALRESATPLDGAPLPSIEHGHGLVAAAAALGGSADGARPTLALREAERGASWVVLEPVAADPDGAPGTLSLKWDDDYDGSWDSPYAPLAPRAVVSAGLALRPFKARVRDDSGRYAEAVAWVRFGERLDPEIAATPVEAGCGCTVPGRGAARSPWTFVAALGSMAYAMVVRRQRRRRAQSQATGVTSATISSR